MINIPIRMLSLWNFDVNLSSGIRDPAVNCWKNRFQTFPENGDGVKMVTKEENYKGSFYTIVLVTKDFSEMNQHLTLMILKLILPRSLCHSILDYLPTTDGTIWILSLKNRPLYGIPWYQFAIRLQNQLFIKIKSSLWRFWCSCCLFPFFVSWCHCFYRYLGRMWLTWILEFFQHHFACWW